ncbi:NAD-dependent epimerase/dehydratase family protein [bacterium]|nr:NAD-dependent epimerase/dehydratase family protein [bacterium]
MKALVTGCAGFIGSHLSERLLEAGHRVVGVDALTDYYDPRIKRRNLTALLPHRNFRFVRADLNRVDLARLLPGIQVIFHQAAQPGVRASWGKTFEIYVDQNIRATQRLLEAVKRMKHLKKFIFAGSSSVYGRVTSLPMRESQRCAPHSPYGVTKLAAENLCGLYHANYGVPAVSLRYFTVYGPRQRPDMAFHRFILAGLAGRPIRIFGDGRQSRDFTYVSDIVSANLAAAARGRPGMIYNLGGGSRILLKDALKILEGRIGRRLRIVHEKKAAGDVDRTGADTRLARRDLGFRPGTPLARGLSAQIAWHRQMVREGILE